ncbi:hypothetical protein [Ureibacillus aquaedulcis]|uniref:Replication initiator protein A n=1 Tax=Ureibacillus aquaedulcis TaxID=3058421 RepID=A0ABT8GPK6_9BACL|nr:hypothetical protein [Ureibacillus sp. BA0131]MDN4493355.1 hypothetical protein [Ureibacillus sp. BA0131]
MKLLSMLGGNAFVMFNKELAHEVSVNGAIIFGQLCSSYESFGSKNMLTKYQGKEYFFLTSEVLEEETALSYKQQLKATKDLEEAGYIETVIMGQPAKKFFHITDKIFGQFSSDKKENLKEIEDVDVAPVKEIFSSDERETLGVTKEHRKPLPFGPTYKEINKKEKDKNNKDNYNCNYKESLDANQFSILLKDACNELYTTFASGRYSKKKWSTLVDIFVSDSIQSKYHERVPEDKVLGFAFKCLEKIADNTDYKNSDDFKEYQEAMIELSRSSTPRNTFNPNTPNYDWLNN